MRSLILLVLWLVVAINAATVRRNILSMSPADIKKWTDAVNALKKEYNPAAGVSTYDSYVVVHASYMRGAHMGPGFFPWHRWFLLQWEAELKRITGDPDMSQPYWDWVHEDSRMNVFADNIVGGNGTGVNSEIADGPFANWTTLDANLMPVKDKIVRTNGAPIKPRPGGMPMNDTGIPQFLPEVETLDEVLSRPIYDSPPYNDTSHESFRNGFEGWNVSGCYLHNRVHLWTGGQMSRVMISVNDPLFWIHHAFVDKIWYLYQQRWKAQPYSGYLPITGARKGHNLRDYMDPWPVRPIDVLDITALGYSYQDNDFVDLVAQGKIELPRKKTTTSASTGTSAASKASGAVTSAVKTEQKTAL